MGLKEQHVGENQEQQKGRKVFANDLLLGEYEKLLQEGYEVSLLVKGNSMYPFLVSNRDEVMLKQITFPLKRGAIVLYRRENGAYVLHRLIRIEEKSDGTKGYYFTGDAQTAIEGPLSEAQMIAIAISARRKEKWLKPGDFWWDFFETCWIRIIPYRHLFVWGYTKLIHLIRHN